MHEAKYYVKNKDSRVKCKLCPRECLISPEHTGSCGVRLNKKGILYSLVYGKPSGIAVDPVEKKPLYHFLPGSRVLSFGTIGCNLFCKHCQNFHISRATINEIKHLETIEPEAIVQQAMEYECDSIAYTYNEPTIFIEYAIDIAKIAKKNKIKNISVTNGYINEKPLKDFCRYLDGANVDLKAFSNEFYNAVAGVPDFSPILKALERLKELGMWFEITNLLIPGYNDSETEIKELVAWVAQKLGKDVPLHFTAFYPAYKLKDIGQTPQRTLINAYEIGKKKLNFVYVGNVYANREANTYCPKCNNLLVERRGFYSKCYFIDGKCTCGYVVPGVWK